MTLQDPLNLPLGRRGRPKTPARVQIEDLLRAAAAQGQALDSEQIAANTGGELVAVRRALSHLLASAQVHPLPPLHGQRLSRYMWGAGPGAEKVAAARETVHHAATTSGAYEARELQPYTGRPGAMRAYELPSLQNGERVTRRPPLSLATNVTEHVR